ncbi:septum formation protein Maf [Hyalomma marginatum]|uniref:Septum formation protein Maf n=1 Tax=Hyalomma marginatum TaxID=34627 RepID=A0A8S4C0F5_9ACAR|nr:septum formation protein Maf [Hyalomma marginatum]
MTTPKLILASSSKRRLSVLSQIGYKPDLIIPADIDETPEKSENPRSLALRLGFEKALKISKEYPLDAVLGADTVVGVGRTILPKGETEADALYCLEKLSGRRHKIYTGVCLIYNGRISKKISVTTLKFKVLSKTEKDEFIKTGQWYGKAGGYALQGFAAQFIESMNGVDTNVLGLPACLVHKLLFGIGIKKDYTISTEIC